jgi:peptide subunit release factor 1 (eRF1)
VEVNLGAATIRAWINEPDLSMRVGQEWSRPHYQINQADRGDRFVQEKISVLKRLMRSGGHTHLILAGDPEMTRRIRHALPDVLLTKLVDIIPANIRDQHDDVVMATLSSFITHEEQESQSIAERLIEGLRNQNLAVAGSAASLDALRWGEVDTLVMVNDYHPDPGWTCTSCKALSTEAPETSTCPQCGERAVRPLDVKEALLRLAGQSEFPVEVVEESDVLMSLGGVGCLLRTRFDMQAVRGVAQN